MDLRPDEWVPAGQEVEGPTEWLGIDVGFVYPAVDSDGDIYRWRQGGYRQGGGHTYGSQVRVTRSNGTSYVRDPYDAGQLADIEARGIDEAHRQRIKSLARQVVGKARRTERGLVLEDWSDFRKRRSAWVELWRAIMLTAKEQGVVVRTVNSAYTSQTCPRCGWVERSNRQNRDAFRCQSCSHVGQADRIAATNIRAFGQMRKQLTSERQPKCANKACASTRPWRTGLCCACYFWRYRYGTMPDADTIHRLEVAKDYTEFVRLSEARHRQVTRQRDKAERERERRDPYVPAEDGLAAENRRRAALGLRPIGVRA